MSGTSITGAGAHASVARTDHVPASKAGTRGYHEIGSISDFVRDEVLDGLIDTDGTLAADSDTVTASQKATKTYADTKMPLSYLDTDGTLAANSDAKVASQKAVKTYADTKIPLSYLDTDTSLTASSDTKIASQNAVKTYIDNAVTGLKWKPSVRAATTTAGTLASSFENGDVIDGVTLTTGMRILIKNQASGAENGIYVVAASGAPTRATDMDSSAEALAATCFVEAGTVNGATQWTCSTTSITLGTTALVFVQVAGAGTYTSDGSTITLTGNSFSVAAGGIGTTQLAADAVTFPKFQNASVNQRVLGRNTSGAGDFEEVTVTQLMDWVGSTRGSIPYRGASAWAALAPGAINLPLVSGGSGADPSYAQLTAAGIANNAVGDAQLRQSSAVSVIGRAGTGTGNVADITAGANDRVLSRVANALGFNQLTAGMFASNTAPATTIAFTATARLLGRATASAGAGEEITLNSDLEFNTGALRLAAYSGGHITKTAGATSATISSGVIVSTMLDATNFFDIDASLTANSDTKVASQKAVKAYADLKIPLTYIDTDTGLAANSDTKLASQKAVKAYADLKIPLTYLDTDTTLAANSDTKLPTQKAIKTYVDNALTGLRWKASVRAATTANGTLASAYANGQTIDGVTLATGDRILLKNQTSGSENGIYTVNASGAPSRASDMDTSAEALQATVFVQEGTTNADTQWTCTNNSVTLGTTALVFAQVSGAGTYTADGTTITLTGNSFALTNNGVSNAKFRQSAGVSVVGNSTGSTANVADITAGADDRVLSRTSGALSFSQLTAGMFSNTTIVAARLSATATNVLFGRKTIGAGAGEEITLDSSLAISGGALGISTTATPSISTLTLTGTATDAVANITRTVGDAATLSVHGFLDGTTITKVSTAATIYCSFVSAVTVSGSQNYDHICGFENYRSLGTSGTITNAWGFMDATFIANSCVITNRYGFIAFDVAGTGTIGTNYAFYADPHTKGTTNWAFYAAGTTPSYFGGNIEVGHASDTTLSRLSAGVLGVEGVALVTISASQTLSNKTFTAPVLGAATGTSLALTENKNAASILSVSNTNVNAASMAVLRLTSDAGNFDLSMTSTLNGLLPSSAVFQSSGAMLLVPTGALTLGSNGNTGIVIATTGVPTLTSPVVNTGMSFGSFAAATVMRDNAAQKFHAHKNGTDVTGLTSGAEVKVTFPTESFDIGSKFDNATNYRWTPSAGKVLLHAKVMATNNISAVLVSIKKNGSTTIATTSNLALFFATGTCDVSVLDDANGTDYYEVYVTPSTTSGTATIEGDSFQTYFEGWHI